MKIVIIGAGMGGLVGALLVAAAGHEVTVLERAASAGGKLRQVEVAGRHIDSGPTVLTMRSVFEEIFAAVGEDLDAHVRLERARVLARHHWPDGTVFDLHDDAGASAEEIARLFGPREAEGYRAFCRHAADTFATLDQPFLRTGEPGIADLMRHHGLTGMSALMRIRAFSTLADVVSAHFRDPRLRQLFGRYATYSGASPFEAPGPLALIAHVEQSGVWLAKDGMQALAAALENLAAARGAVFRYGCEATRIVSDGDAVNAVETGDGERFAADAVIMNGDPAALAAGLLGEEARAAAGGWSPRERSLSALTLSLVAPPPAFPLTRHNVFFSADYRAEFDDIFHHGRLPRAPTVYLCAQDRNAANGPAPEGDERMFLIVNAPANGDTNPASGEEVELCIDATRERLALAGIHPAPDAATCRITTPQAFDRLFPATGGALYGRSCHGTMAPFQRPTARSRLKGLYLAGGAVHPGPGLPMAALSGWHAGRAVLRDFASTATFRAAAMPGGMSTPSPTTGKARSR